MIYLANYREGKIYELHCNDRVLNKIITYKFILNKCHYILAVKSLNTQLTQNGEVDLTLRVDSVYRDSLRCSVASAVTAVAELLSYDRKVEQV